MIVKIYKTKNDKSPTSEIIDDLETYMKENNLVDRDIWNSTIDWIERTIHFCKEVEEVEETTPPTSLDEVIEAGADIIVEPTTIKKTKSKSK